MIKPIDSNINFDSLNMAVTKEKAFIMAVDDEKRQTFYVLYYDE